MVRSVQYELDVGFVFSNFSKFNWYLTNPYRYIIALYRILVNQALKFGSSALIGSVLWEFPNHLTCTNL